MRGWHALTKGMTILALAGLAGTAAQLSASAASTSASASSGWGTRVLIPISKETVSEAVKPSANVAYEMTARDTGGDGPWRLQRVGLVNKDILLGRHFPVSGVSLAAGYVWVSGLVVRHGKSAGLAIYQVNPRSLGVIRSWDFRNTTASDIAVTGGPGGTAWIGVGRTLRRVSTRTGAIVASARLRSGRNVTGISTDPALSHLYVAAAPKKGGGLIREFSAKSGRLLASPQRNPLKFALHGADVTGVPGGVWASFRLGMKGNTILLRRGSLRSVHLGHGHGLFSWDMGATTLYGSGSLWEGTVDGIIGCIAPATGRVRAHATLKRLEGSGELLALSQSRHVIYAAGKSDILAITAPARCWR
jgi:hypothetical protein